MKSTANFFIHRQVSSSSNENLPFYLENSDFISLADRTHDLGVSKIQQSDEQEINREGSGFLLSTEPVNGNQSQNWICSEEAMTDLESSAAATLLLFQQSFKKIEPSKVFEIITPQIDFVNTDSKTAELFTDNKAITEDFLIEEETILTSVNPCVCKNKEKNVLSKKDQLKEKNRLKRKKYQEKLNSDPLKAQKRKEQCNKSAKKRRALAKQDPVALRKLRLRQKRYRQRLKNNPERFKLLQETQKRYQERIKNNPDRQAKRRSQINVAQAKYRKRKRALMKKKS